MRRGRRIPRPEERSGASPMATDITPSGAAPATAPRSRWQVRDLGLKDARTAKVSSEVFRKSFGSLLVTSSFDYVMLSHSEVRFSSRPEAVSFLRKSFGSPSEVLRTSFGSPSEVLRKSASFLRKSFGGPSEVLRKSASFLRKSSRRGRRWAQYLGDGVMCS